MISTAWNTYEVRWFLKEPHAGLRQFFDRLSPEQVSTEERTDDYLLTGREDLGIKLREGRLEVKTRSDVPGRIQIGSVLGTLEVWSKRGCTPEQGAIQAQRTGWTSIHKKRWATLYRPGPSGLQYDALSDTAPKGIQVEYTELQIGSSRWFTAGLEWPARMGITLTNLPFSEELERTNLDLTQCMGYPKFLLDLHR